MCTPVSSHILTAFETVYRTKFGQVKDHTQSLAAITFADWFVLPVHHSSTSQIDCGAEFTSTGPAVIRSDKRADTMIEREAS